MSGVFKAIGKVFKKIVKVAVKIAPFALAAAAVVFTGGAALGLLPTFSAAVGGLVSSLGLSAAVTGALTGAITSAGFGAALGFVTGGKKGLQKGALMGALTGGVMGLASPGMFGITKAIDPVTGLAKTTTMNALAHGGDAFGAAGKGAFNVTTSGGISSAVPKGIAPVNIGSVPVATATTPDELLNSMPDIGGQAQALGDAASQGSQVAVDQAAQGVQPLADTVTKGIAPVDIGSVETATAANPTDVMNPLANVQKALDTQASVASGSVGGIPASGGSGILDFLNNNKGLVGSVLQGLGGDSDTKKLKKQYEEEYKLRQKLAAAAYGGVYSGKTDPFGISNLAYKIPQPRFYYDSATKQVVDRQNQGG